MITPLSTFPNPRTLPLVVAAEVTGGRSGWEGFNEQCHARPRSQGRAQSYLCSFPFSTVATSSSGRSLLPVAKLLHGLALPCLTSPAFHLRNSRSSRVSEVAGLLCACSFFARSPVVSRRLLSYVHLYFRRTDI